MKKPFAGLAILALMTAACAGKEPASASDAAARRGPSPRQQAGAAPDALRAAELTRVPSVTYGPYLGLGAGGALVVWAAEAGAERRFSAVPLSADGRPLGAAQAIAPAPDNLNLVAVRAVEAGYVLVYTRRNESAEIVEVACLGPRGEPAGAPSVIGPLAGRGIWLEAVPQKSGVLVFSGARLEDGKRRGELAVVPIDAKCRAGERTILVKDALAWQAVPLGAGALLAVVRPGAATGAPGSTSAQAEASNATVEAFVLDAAGKPRATTVVSKQPGADLDLDAMAFGGADAAPGAGAVLAWTQRGAIEPRIASAAIDADGKVTAGPEALTPPEGEQALVRLVPPFGASQRGYAVWESLGAPPAAGRRLELSAIDAQGRATGPRAHLEYASDDGGVPEFAATAKGLAALTLAPPCKLLERCDGQQLAPMFVEVDASFAPLAAEPLRLAPLGGRIAELGFGLGCTAQGCLAIAARTETPAPVFAVELAARSNAWRSPLSRDDPNRLPRVVEHEAVSRLDSLAAFALESSGEARLLSTITEFDPTTPWQRLKQPAADGRFEPLRARIALERMSAFGKPAEPLRASPISLRAHSLGKVAVAEGDPARGDVLVAWAGVDAGEPQIFLTLVSKHGEKVGQRMLTHKKGDLGDIAASWVGDGWVVAWVDERFSDPEVFATKVDAKLNRTAPEQRITSAPGVATDVAIAFDGSALRLSWADARNADLPGHADVYTALLRRRDAAREGADLCVAATRAHSFSVGIAPFASGFAFAWVERGEDGGAPGNVALATLGADGALGPLVPAPMDEGEPRAVAIACAEARCRLAALVEGDDGSALAVATWPGSGAPDLAPVLGLASETVTSVPPWIDGDVVYFADRRQKSAVVRRARVAW